MILLCSLSLTHSFIHSLGSRSNQCDAIACRGKCTVFNTTKREIATSTSDGINDKCSPWFKIAKRNTVATATTNNNLFRKLFTMTFFFSPFLLVGKMCCRDASSLVIHFWPKPPIAPLATVAAFDLLSSTAHALFYILIWNILWQNVRN